MVENIENIEDFENKISNEKITVVDFFANWCGPCRMLKPVIEDASEKFSNDFSFYKVDTDESEDLAQKMGIYFLPTIITFSAGKELSRFSGYIGEDDLAKYLNEVLKLQDNN